jgi:hypothetical protein
MPESNAVRIEGLRELERAFKLYGRGMEKGIREALEAASEPVRTDAQSLATSSIKQSAVDWTRMRIGVTRRTAYVAPMQRGRRTPPNRRRSNLRERLLTGAMEPALTRNIPKVEREIGVALDDLGRMWERV